MATFARVRFIVGALLALLFIVALAAPTAAQQPAQSNPTRRGGEGAADSA